MSLIRNVALLAMAALPFPLAAQPCSPDWSSDFPAGDLDGAGLCMVVFDDDGPGPRSPGLFVGGQFHRAGGVDSRALARWDGASWSDVGGGVLGQVYALAVLDIDGPGPLPTSLFVGGNFLSAGGVAANNVARWDGSAWHSVGTGVAGQVRALAAFDPDGPGPQPQALYVGGQFYQAGGSQAHAIARWDGLVWSEVGGGLGVQGIVSALRAFDDDGPGPRLPGLYVGGDFDPPAGIASPNVLRWDHSGWSGVGGGLGPQVNCLEVFDQDGPGPLQPALFAGGNLVTPSISGLARWSGSSWEKVGPGLTGGPGSSVYSLALFDPDGDGPQRDVLHAAGTFTYSGTAPEARGVAIWDGTSWSAMGLGLLGGSAGAYCAAPFDPDGSGPQPGSLYIAGAFTQAGGMPANNFAQWRDSSWRMRLGGGLNATGRALEVFDPDGAGPQRPELFVGGSFTRAGGEVTRGVARWSRGWTRAGNGVDGSVYTLAADGPTLYAGGDFTVVWATRIAGWNGAEWLPLGTGMTGSPVHAISMFDEDGGGPQPRRLFAGGSFTHAGGVYVSSIARWNGSAWSALGAGVNDEVRALCTFDPDDSGPSPPVMVVAGEFTSAGGVQARNVASWNGTAWSNLGAGVSTVATKVIVFDDDGPGPRTPSLYAAGTFSIRRWDGQAWVVVGTGINGQVLAAEVFDADGGGPGLPALYVGGLFSAAGTTPVSNVARWDGTSWSALGSGVNQSVWALRTFDEDGDGPGLPVLMASGDFTVAGGRSAERVARWGCPELPCYANCDGSTSPPVLNVNDFLCFQTKYAAADPAANCDGSTTPPILNVNDFLCFQSKFAAGCP